MKEFLELACYVLALVTEENNKYRRFEDGLRGVIKIPIVVAGDRDFGRLIHFATKLERHLNEK